jgi:hypothetical protein
MTSSYEEFSSSRARGCHGRSQWAAEQGVSEGTDISGGGSVASSVSDQAGDGQCVEQGEVEDAQVC